MHMCKEVKRRLSQAMRCDAQQLLAHNLAAICRVLRYLLLQTRLRLSS